MTTLGDTMVYFAAALAVVAVAVLALVVGVGTMVQVYRIGDSGARATWGDSSLSEQGGESE